MKFNINCIKKGLDNLKVLTTKLERQTAIGKALNTSRKTKNYKPLYDTYTKMFGDKVGFRMFLLNVYKEKRGTFRGMRAFTVEKFDKLIEGDKKLQDVIYEHINSKEEIEDAGQLEKEMKDTYKNKGVKELFDTVINKKLSTLTNKIKYEIENKKNEITQGHTIGDSVGYGTIINGRGEQQDKHLASIGAIEYDKIEKGKSDYKNNGEVLVDLGKFAHTVLNLFKGNKDLTFKDLGEKLLGNNKKIYQEITKLFGDDIDMKDFKKELDSYKYKKGISAKLGADVDKFYISHLRGKEIKGDINNSLKYIEDKQNRKRYQKVADFFYETMGLMNDELKARLGNNKFVRQIVNKLGQVAGGIKNDMGRLEKMVKPYGFDSFGKMVNYLDEDTDRIRYIMKNDLLDYTNKNILPNYNLELNSLNKRIINSKGKKKNLLEIQKKTLENKIEQIKRWSEGLSDYLENGTLHHLKNEDLVKVKGFINIRALQNKYNGIKMFKGGYAMNNFEDLVKEDKAIMAKTIQLGNKKVSDILGKLLGLNLGEKEIETDIFKTKLTGVIDSISKILGNDKLKDEGKLYANSTKEDIKETLGQLQKDIEAEKTMNGDKETGEEYNGMLDNIKRMLKNIGENMTDMTQLQNRLKELQTKINGGVNLKELDDNDIFSLLFVLRSNGTDKQTISYIFGQRNRFNKTGRHNKAINRISFNQGIKKSYDIDPRLLELYGFNEYSKKLMNVFDSNIRIANNVRYLGNNNGQLHLLFDNIEEGIRDKMDIEDRKILDSGNTSEEIIKAKKKKIYLSNQLAHIQKDHTVINDLLNLGVVHKDKEVGIGKAFSVIADFVNKLGILKLIHGINVAQDIARGMPFLKDNGIKDKEGLGEYMNSTYKIMIDSPLQTETSKMLNNVLDKAFKRTGMEKVNVAVNKKVFRNILGEAKKRLLEIKKGVVKDDFSKSIKQQVEDKGVDIQDTIDLIDELNDSKDLFETLGKLNDNGILPAVNNYMSRFTTVNSMTDVPMMYLKNSDNNFVQAYGTFMKTIFKLTGTGNEGFKDNYVRSKFLQMAGWTTLMGGTATALYDIIGGGLSGEENDKLQQKLTNDFYENLVGSYTLWYSYIVNGILYKGGILDHIGIHDDKFKYIYSNTSNIFMGALGSNIRGITSILNDTSKASADLFGGDWNGAEEITSQKLTKDILKYVPMLNKASNEYFNQ